MLLTLHTHTFDATHVHNARQSCLYYNRFQEAAVGYSSVHISFLKDLREPSLFSEGGTEDYRGGVNEIMDSLITLCIPSPNPGADTKCMPF